MMNDPDFKIKEIDYFIEHFRVRSHDSLATSIAEDLNGFLDLGGDCLRILSYLEELEEYAPQTGKPDFVWELIMARRKIRNYYLAAKNHDKAFESAWRAAKHFDILCQLSPSTYHLYCRIWENLMAAQCLREIKSKARQVKEIYELCYRLICEVEDDSSDFYYQIASKLYVNLYVFSVRLLDPPDESHDWLAKCIDIDMKRYETKKEPEALGHLITFYNVLTSFSKFSYEREKSRLNIVCAWADAAIHGGQTSLKHDYALLKRILRKFGHPA